MLEWAILEERWNAGVGKIGWNMKCRSGQYWRRDEMLVWANWSRDEMLEWAIMEEDEMLEWAILEERWNAGVDNIGGEMKCWSGHTYNVCLEKGLDQLLWHYIHYLSIPLSAGPNPFRGTHCLNFSLKYKQLGKLFLFH